MLMFRPALPIRQASIITTSIPTFNKEGLMFQKRFLVATSRKAAIKCAVAALSVAILLFASAGVAEALAGG